ncbi:MAG: hypothetical protein P1P64_03270 [Treponemataceae bacterium]
MKKFCVGVLMVISLFVIDACRHNTDKEVLMRFDKEHMDILNNLDV